MLEITSHIENQDIFLYPDPDILDFTSNKPAKLSILTKNHIIDIPFDDSTKKTKETLANLQFALNNSNILITWNIKNFLTYAKGRTGSEFKLNNKIYDLAFLESYLGIKNTRPKSLEEASKRLEIIVKNKNWSVLNKIYQKVYLPLIKALPRLETYGVGNRSKKRKVYPFYEIDGQVNGRLRCHNAFSQSYNPHTLSTEEKENLRPLGFDSRFIYLDFKNMEVSVLQWLSQDQFIGSILDNEADFYESFWNNITNSQSGHEFRKVCKELFLPIMYGLGTETLSNKLNVPMATCQEIVKRLKSKCSVAYNWISNNPDNQAEDYFGRRRLFDSLYKIRNFKVQSPAALICLHKLTKLCESLDGVCMNIHDGYVIVVDRDLEAVQQKARNILESEEDLYPGLRLRVECKSGKSLNQLKVNEYVHTH